MKMIIVNADDFGLTSGVNKGIIEAHVKGVVSSTSLMVNAPAAAEAVELAKKYPELDVGLHFATTSENGRPLFDLDNVNAVGKELENQYKKFLALVGRKPTHIDSHQHVHTRPNLKPLFVSWARKRELPLRGGSVPYNGGFYGQWTDWEGKLHRAPELITLQNLEKMLRQLPEGVTELGCHPGYVTKDLEGDYVKEREAELKVLTDPAAKNLVKTLGIKLINFSQVPR